MSYFRNSILFYIIPCVYVLVTNRDEEEQLGGKQVPIEDWPFIAVLFNDRAICGYGIFITPKCVVTNADILLSPDTDIEDIVIGYGSEQLRGLSKMNPLAFIINKDEDLGIIVLEENVALSRKVELGIFSYNKPNESDVCQTAGWAVSWENGTYSTNFLREYNAVVSSYTDCSIIADENNICTNESKDLYVCPFSEGAPLVCQGQICGISKKTNCGNYNPNVWHDVSLTKLHNFILDNVYTNCSNFSNILPLLILHNKQIEVLADIKTKSSAVRISITAIYFYCYYILKLL